MKHSSSTPIRCKTTTGAPIMIPLVASQAGICCGITSGACPSRGVSFLLLCHTSCSIRSPHALITLTSYASEDCGLLPRGYVKSVALSLFTVVAWLPEEVNKPQVKHASSLASFLCFTTNTRTASVRGCLVNCHSLHNITQPLSATGAN
jgi:hypothetical protein